MRRALSIFGPPLKPAPPRPIHPATLGTARTQTPRGQATGRDLTAARVET